MNAAWEAIMETRTCLLQAMDENTRLREEMQLNHDRLGVALARLDKLVGSPSNPATHDLAALLPATPSQPSGTG